MILSASSPHLYRFEMFFWRPRAVGVPGKAIHCASKTHGARERPLHWLGDAPGIRRAVGLGVDRNQLVADADIFHVELQAPVVAVPQLSAVADPRVVIDFG